MSQKEAWPRKSLAFDGTFIKKATGGIANDSLELLGDFQAGGVDVDLYSRDGNVNLGVAPSHQIKQYRLKGVVSLIKNSTLDINTESFYAWNSQLWGVQLKAERQNFVRIHDTFPVDHPDWFPFRSRHMYRLGFENLRNSNAVGYVNSLATQRALRSHGIKNELRLLYCKAGIYESFPCQNCPYCRQEWMTPKEFILAIGTIEPRKNYVNLISEWQKQKVHLPLVILGNPGWFRSYNQQVLKTASSNNLISFAKGFCNYSKIEVMKLSWGIISPSIVEGFNMPLMEARRMNLPILISNCEVNRELHSDYAFWLEDDFQNLKALIQKMITPKITSSLNQEFLKKFDSLRQFQVDDFIGRLAT